MKIEYSEGRYLIIPENKIDQDNLDSICVEARKLLPKLKKLWQVDLISVSNFSELGPLLKKNNASIVDFKKLIIDGMGTPLVMKNKSTGGRPLDDRTILACMKLLLGAPYKLVLEQEKKWRVAKYECKIRDYSVTNSLKRVKYKATRDADMCIKRSRDLLDKFFESHPEYFLPFQILAAIAAETLDKKDLS